MKCVIDTHVWISALSSRDTAFACNAHYLVSDDKHYNPLNRVDFPKIKRVRLVEFQLILNDKSFTP